MEILTELDARFEDRVLHCHIRLKIAVSSIRKAFYSSWLSRIVNTDKVAKSSPALVIQISFFALYI
jgi:hypothetical protein